MHYSELEFPKDSIFLVTGGAGFIGSNLCEALINMGHKVRCLDNLSTGLSSNMNNFINHKNFEFIKGDITSLKDCIKATDGVTYVLHQAAWGSVPRSIEMPLFYEEVNIRGTLNMLEASRINKIDKFVYASSSSVYGDEPKLPKIEGVEGKVLSPYALTKKVNEEYARLYSKLYNLDTYGLRYFNVFGRRQNPNGAYAAVIPKFINMLQENQSPTINGDGTYSRDFTYIENVIDANLKSCNASKNYAGESFNIASGGRISILDLYDKIAQLIEKQKIKPFFASLRKGDIPHSNADIQNAISKIGYNVKYSFLEGIEEYISEITNE